MRLRPPPWGFDAFVMVLCAGLLAVHLLDSRDFAFVAIGMLSTRAGIMLGKRAALRDVMAGRFGPPPSDPPPPPPNARQRGDNGDGEGWRGDPPDPPPTSAALCVAGALRSSPTFGLMLALSAVLLLAWR